MSEFSYVPHFILMDKKRMEANIDYWERKSKTKELSKEEKDNLELTYTSLKNLNEMLERTTYCRKCSCVISDEEKYQDICCICK